jgi:predicted GNAT family acetyltransferase
MSIPYGTLSAPNAFAALNNRHTLAQNPLIVETLSNNETAETLEFLARRPLHTVMMTGMIRDNGIVSKYNRGNFYACRNNRQQIEGVALIGHLTMLEAETERAKKTLAMKAKEFKQAHMMFGEQQRLAEFWKYYSNGGQPMRSAFNELLFSLNSDSAQNCGQSPMRRAEMSDLELILPVQAEMAQTESGVNPMIVDPEGFRRRCARRIEMGRTWVVVENNRLDFKTDVMVDTSQVSYIEGIYVAPSKRGQGFGSKCLSHLCRVLLESTKSICLLVSELNASVRSFYEKIGFGFQCLYQQIFLQKMPILEHV